MIFKQIKDLELAKADEIIKIESEEYPGGGVDIWILKSIFHYGKIFVIEEDNKIASIAEFMSSFNTGEAYLYGICTKSTYQGKGYGKFLIENSHKELKNIGIKKIFLTVAPSNINAIKLYENLGYNREQFIKDEYGKGIDRYLMSIDI